MYNHLHTDVEFVILILTSTCGMMAARGVFLAIPSYLLRPSVLQHLGRKFFRLCYQPLEPIPNDDWPTPVNDQSLAQNASSFQADTAF